MTHMMFYLGFNFKSGFFTLKPKKLLEP